MLLKNLVIILQLFCKCMYMYLASMYIHSYVVIIIVRSTETALNLISICTKACPWLDRICKSGLFVTLVISGKLLEAL